IVAGRRSWLMKGERISPTTSWIPETSRTVGAVDSVVIAAPQGSPPAAAREVCQYRYCQRRSRPELVCESDPTSTLPRRSQLRKKRQSRVTTVWVPLDAVPPAPPPLDAPPCEGCPLASYVETPITLSPVV